MLLIIGIDWNLIEKNDFIYLAWIASKVKSAAPVLPSGGETTSIPSANGEPVVIPSGAMGISEGNTPTSPRKSGRKKTKTSRVSTIPGSTTVANGVTEATGGGNDDGNEKDDAPTNDEATKRAVDRAIRAILNRP